MFEKILAEAEKIREKNLRAQEQIKIARQEANLDLMLEAEKATAHIGTRRNGRNNARPDWDLNNPDDYLSLLDAAEYTGVNHATLRRWVHDQKISFVWIKSEGSRPKYAISKTLADKILKAKKKMA